MGMEVTKKERKIKLMFNEIKNFFIYEGEDKKFEDGANMPALNVEIYTETGGDRNIIGQLHQLREGKIVFHFSDHAPTWSLDKEAVLTIIKAMEYLEEEGKKFDKKHGR